MNCVYLWRIVVSLHSESLLHGMIVFKPSDIGLGHTKDLAFDFTAVDANQRNLIWWLDELRVLGHDHDNRLAHFAVIILSKALVSAHISGAECIDLEPNNTIASINASVLFAQLDVFAFELERN